MPAEAATDTLATLRSAHAHLLKPAHVGVLVPWGNTMVETELPRLGLGHVVFHYARLVPAHRYRDADDFLAEIAAAVPDTLQQFARLTLAGTLVACTSTGFLNPDAYQNTAVVDAFDALQILFHDRPRHAVPGPAHADPSHPPAGSRLRRRRTRQPRSGPSG
jgi:hypothetical protein